MSFVIPILPFHSFAKLPDKLPYGNSIGILEEIRSYNSATLSPAVLPKSNLRFLKVVGASINDDSKLTYMSS